MLGHKDAKTTSIYVNTTLSRLHDSMRRFGTQPFHTVSHEAQMDPRPVCNNDTENNGKAPIRVKAIPSWNSPRLLMAYAAFFFDVVVSIFSSRFNASRSLGRCR